MKNNRPNIKSLYSAAIICVLIIGFISIFLSITRLCNILTSRSDLLGQDQSSYVDILVDNMGIRLDANSNNTTCELPWLTTEFPLKIQLNSNTNYTVWFDNIKLENDKPLQYLFGNLSPTHNIPVKIVENTTHKEIMFTLKTWPTAMPTYHTAGSSPIDGDYYITPLTSKWGCAYKISQNGDLKYYRFSPEKSYHDFKKVITPNGDIRYILFESYDSVHRPAVYTTSGCYVIYDENYHELHRLHMEESPKISSSNWPLDQHDILYVSDSEYYIFAYVEKYVNNIPNALSHSDNGTLVAATIIQGFKNNNLFFEWDSSDYPELYTYSTENNDYLNTSADLADYMHANSIDKDPSDGNIIVSFRHLDSIIKINVQNNNIMWILGGLGDNFHLTEEQKFSRQHYARFNPDGSITLFDNGNAKQQTRIVRIWLDETEKIIKDYVDYKNEGYFSSATGSAQLLSLNEDIYCVGWGYRSYNFMDNYPNMSEVNFSTDETNFSLTFDDPNLQTYRCVKY